MGLPCGRSSWSARAGPSRTRLVLDVAASAWTYWRRDRPARARRIPASAAGGALAVGRRPAGDVASQDARLAARRGRRAGWRIERLLRAAGAGPRLRPVRVGRG